MHISEYDYLFKLLLIGDFGVGKGQPLTPGPDDCDVEMKRSHVGSINGNSRRVSPQSGSSTLSCPFPPLAYPLPASTNVALIRDASA
ncbi:uncharacterized protein C8Q71DRAFT_859275 [Rhodofomes roseus]|uniref:Uncharacterized protein n=1 Tax=Rhodofomes roseus TaxID=34475 RepID=A0ABQ8KBK8_9APHY|nr:uncharacterized protein C8Q71DRAFT_859275 [Rhodofomes roseus]KAH9834931.1 hypothetical protein C8Q71DRAFT_859275 [Rhodofomes roseus]